MQGGGDKNRGFGKFPFFLVVTIDLTSKFLFYHCLDQAVVTISTVLTRKKLEQLPGGQRRAIVGPGHGGQGWHGVLWNRLRPGGLPGMYSRVSMVVRVPPCSPLLLLSVLVPHAFDCLILLHVPSVSNSLDPDDSLRRDYSPLPHCGSIHSLR